MDIIDTHCHIQMEQYDADREAVIERARQAGVGMICVGVDLESSRRAISLAEQHEGIWASVGLHPNDNLGEVYDQAFYQEIVTHPKVVAVGEIGLDYYRTTDPAQRAFQKKRFVEQLTLSKKPLIIHCRDAHEDMLEILPKRSGVIHSFTGTTQEALQYIERGYHIGLNGIITFTRQYDDMVRGVPLEKILLETDSPYLTPEPHRGKRNEPSYIIEIAQKVAELKGFSLNDVLNITTNNAKRLFLL